MDVDVSGLIPEARPIAARAAEVYLRHTGPWFVGLIAHGSAVKGGVIAGCSDIDFQLYLDEAAFTADEGAQSRAGYVPLATSLAVHRELARIDPAPFQYIQCYAMPAGRLPEGWTGPIPGAWRLVAGRLAVAGATPEQLRAAAHERLATLEVFPEYLRDGLLEHGGGRLERRARLLCTDVWPTLYCVLIARGGEPIETWNLTKQQAMARLPAGDDIAGAIAAFYEAVLRYYPAQTSVDAALAMIEHGVAFLHAAKSRTE